MLKAQMFSFLVFVFFCDHTVIFMFSHVTVYFPFVTFYVKAFEITLDLNK